MCADGPVACEMRTAGASPRTLGRAYRTRDAYVSCATGVTSRGRGARVLSATGEASCARFAWDRPGLARAGCACRARFAYTTTFHFPSLSLPFPFSSLLFPTCISPTIKHQEQPKYSIHHQCNEHNTTTTTTTKHNNVGFSITHLGFPIFVFDFGDFRRFSTWFSLFQPPTTSSTADLRRRWCIRDSGDEILVRGGGVRLERNVRMMRVISSSILGFG